MYHPTIFFDPQFTLYVMAGWVVQAAGAGALLLAAVWFSLAGEWRGGTAGPPTAFRALTGLGFVMSLGGILWQLVGYWGTGVLSW
ncbi:MAG: hypothetical protein ACREKQ_06395 [Candidatus Rokuibacteriota bacterium]